MGDGRQACLQLCQSLSLYMVLEHTQAEKSKFNSDLMLIEGNGSIHMYICQKCMYIYMNIEVGCFSCFVFYKRRYCHRHNWHGKDNLNCRAGCFSLFFFL